MLITHAFNESRVRTIYNFQPPDIYFDYLVTLPENQLEALQKKIREQLGLVGHHETRNVPVYVIKSNGPGKIPEALKGEQIVENGHYHGPISSMWYSLECYLQKPLLAETDSQADHDVDLQWVNPKGEAFPAKVPQVEALRQALQEQLGLELMATNRPVKMLVIEKAK